MRHGVRAGMPLGTLPCTMLASLGGQITFFSKKTLIFWEITPNLWPTQSRPGHAAKAKAAPMGTQPRPRQPPWARGTQPRPVHVAALASHGQEARSQGPMGTLPRPHGHAAKAQEARCQWARCQGQGSPPWHAAKAKACSEGQGRSPPWAHGFGREWGG